MAAGRESNQRCTSPPMARPGTARLTVTTMPSSTNPAADSTTVAVVPGSWATRTSGAVLLPPRVSAELRRARVTIPAASRVIATSVRSSWPAIASRIPLPVTAR